VLFRPAIDLDQYEPDNQCCWVLEFTLNRPVLGKMTPTRGFSWRELVSHHDSPTGKSETFVR